MRNQMKKILHAILAFIQTLFLKRLGKRIGKKFAAETAQMSGTLHKALGTDKGLVAAPATPLGRKLGLTTKAKSGERLRSEKFRAEHFNLPKGAMWNPLAKFPKNKPCFCGNLKKFKKCCRNTISSCVSLEVGRFVKQRWSSIIAGHIVYDGKSKAWKPKKPATRAQVDKEVRRDGAVV